MGQLNLRRILKYRHFPCNFLGDSILSSKAKSPTYCVSSARPRTLNKGNFWLWFSSSSGSSSYNLGNLIKIPKHVGLSWCQGSKSVAHLNGNSRDAEVIETGENEASLESNASGEIGEAEGVEAPSLDELREYLLKALKDLEVARLSSTMFKEKAQSISETAIEFQDEASEAWDDVNRAFGSIQDNINEEIIAKEVVQEATLALHLAEGQLQQAIDKLEIAKESDSWYDNEVKISIQEGIVKALQQEVDTREYRLGIYEAELREVQSREEELQNELDCLNVVAQEAQMKASTAEEDVANIMLLAEQAVVYELEAAERADDAEIALQMAEKNLALSSIETVDSAVDGTIAVVVSQVSAEDGVVEKHWEGAEVAELLEPLPDGLPCKNAEFSSINNLLAQAIARAPPEPPSPVTIVMIGTLRPNIVLKLGQLLHCPSSSDFRSAKAPGVSTNVTMGNPS